MHSWIKLKASREEELVAGKQNIGADRTDIFEINKTEELRYGKTLVARKAKVAEEDIMQKIWGELGKQKWSEGDIY